MNYIGFTEEMGTFLWLKYWKLEYVEHGSKVLEINTEPVMKLPSE